MRWRARTPRTSFSPRALPRCRGLITHGTATTTPTCAHASPHAPLQLSLEVGPELPEMAAAVAMLASNLQRQRSPGGPHTIDEAAIIDGVAEFFAQLPPDLPLEQFHACVARVARAELLPRRLLPQARVADSLFVSPASPHSLRVAQRHYRAVPSIYRPPSAQCCRSKRSLPHLPPPTVLASLGRSPHACNRSAGSARMRAPSWKSRVQFLA